MPPTAGTPGGTRRKRRSPSRQRTPGGGVKDYVKEYQESLVLPPLDHRSRSDAKVVTFPKGREVYKQSTHHHHNNLHRQSSYHHSNVYVQSDHPQDSNMCQKSVHHHSNKNGTMTLNLRFSAFHSHRSASANDVDAGDAMCSASPSLTDSNRKTLYLVMKKYDSEPEFRVWPPEGGEERLRRSSVHFLCDETESDDEMGVALSVDIDWEDIDRESTPSFSPNLE